MKAIKSKQGFINFFSKIPEKKWTTCGQYHTEDGRRSCAIGHIRKKFGYESATEDRLVSLTNRAGYLLVRVNDKKSDKFPQRSAKARVIALLKSAKGR